MVCYEDLPHTQYLHHYGVVLEEDHHDVPAPSATGKVRTDSDNAQKMKFSVICHAPILSVQFSHCVGSVGELTKNHYRLFVSF